MERVRELLTHVCKDIPGEDRIGYSAEGTESVNRRIGEWEKE